ncbi:MAG: arylsulfatase [Phycisphaerales bacterium]|nr:arylsulfatase [Phycisphaerales bacterium]
MSRPNIVLIFVDQWRGDCLSCADHPVVRTPFIDKLALYGGRFNHAYSAVSSCIAARVALFTGLTQRTHGRVGYQDGIPWNYPTNIASEFKRNGYQTQAVGKMHVSPPRHRMGFDNVTLHDGFVHFLRDHYSDVGLVDDYLPWLRQRAGIYADDFAHGVNCNSNVARPWDKPEELHPTNYVMHESIEFLRKRDTTMPFFLHMSFHRPHPPYDPPAWAFEQYLHTKMPDVPVGDWADEYAGRYENHRPDCFAGKVSPDILQRARAGYYGHMTHIDHQINRFIESLAFFGLRKNTVICFTSDHGELMGDHNLWRKCLPYEGSARIPMIFEGDCAGIKPGTTFDQPVELRDVMPTLLDCAGLEIPACVEGQSVLPMLRGEKPDNHNWREYIHGEHTTFRGGSAHYLTNGKEKYVWLSWSGREQFFDLQTDPQELHDLAIAHPNSDRITAWRNRLITELTGREENYITDGKLTPRRGMPQVLSHVAREIDETKAFHKRLVKV